MGLSLATAERWVERWELQQQRYAVDREERFTVVADVVARFVIYPLEAPVGAVTAVVGGTLLIVLLRRRAA